MTDEVEFEEEKHETLEPDRSLGFGEAVLFSSDWTVETILSQLKRENIKLNPNFQRREAWGSARKSRFIETIIVGLPAPQLVLAEVKGQRGKYIVLDGKQRLLSLLRFTESEDDRSLGFGLSGLEIRSELSRKKYYNFKRDAEISADLDAFLNYTIRTVIIRNWPNSDFLHQVFLRLNTGSVTLSPQELRQAIAPGDFTTFADEFSALSVDIQTLLGRNTPDPRMRDVELLVRHFAFKEHLQEYRGKMKRFLDEVCISENASWNERQEHIRAVCEEFVAGIRALSEIFDETLARKVDSRSFNRAIFDALAYYASEPRLRQQMIARADQVRVAYSDVIRRADFLEAIESDTAGLPNTASRIRIWGTALGACINLPVDVPVIREGQIAFERA